MKMEDFGMTEEIWIFRGTWSEVVRVRDERMESGRIESQARLMNARSIHSRVGLILRLDQVYWRSMRGSSMRERSLIVSLKAAASLALK
jgi:hypothetical protein